VLEPTTARDLDEAITWVEAAEVPFLVRLEESLVTAYVDVLDRHDLERMAEPMPGMLMRPLPPAPAPAPGVTSTRVTHATYEKFIETLIATGLPQEMAKDVFPRRLIDTPTNAYFLGELDGQPAGTSVAIRTGESGGIYSVGTVEAARRRGVGSAVTWAAVDAIRDWGCSSVVLQSSVMGHPVYLGMGFRDVVHYARFRPRSTPVLVDF
jgi:GNAT superfamily N-acetyltransferase